MLLRRASSCVGRPSTMTPTFLSSPRGGAPPAAAGKAGGRGKGAVSAATGTGAAAAPSPIRLSTTTVMLFLIFQALMAWTVFMAYHEWSMHSSDYAGRAGKNSYRSSLFGRPAAPQLASGGGLRVQPLLDATSNGDVDIAGHAGPPSQPPAAVNAPPPPSAVDLPSVALPEVSAAAHRTARAALMAQHALGKGVASPPYAAPRDPLPPGWQPPYTLDYRGVPVTDEFVYVTLVAGNSAARHAIALLQSLADVKTAFRVVVMLSRGGMGSPECSDNTFRATLKRDGHYRCDANDTTAPEIASQPLLDAMERLGARIVITDEILRTRYTETIAGGRNFAWGMSLNKLQASSGGQ